jgi:tRNA dimethylallyltransferase
VMLGLRLERARLVARLDARVERMWRDGLVNEVARLRPSGFGTTAARAIGYAQALRQLDGEFDEAAAIAETQALTRKYARRQVSWFGRSQQTTWFDADDPTRVDAAFEAVFDAITPS